MVCPCTPSCSCCCCGSVCGCSSTNVLFFDSSNIRLISDSTPLICDWISSFTDWETALFCSFFSLSNFCKLTIASPACFIDNVLSSGNCALYLLIVFSLRICYPIFLHFFHIILIRPLLFSLTNTHNISVDLLSLSYLDVSVHLVYYY